MKYSPGPWQAVETEDGDLFVDMMDGHNIHVCNVEGSCGTCYANARLIKLAPQMYELLGRVNATWGMDIDDERMLKEIIKEIENV